MSNQNSLPILLYIHEIGQILPEMVPIIDVILKSEIYTEKKIHQASAGATRKLWAKEHHVVGYKVNLIPTSHNNGRVTFYIFAGNLEIVQKYLLEGFSSNNQVQFRESRDFLIREDAGDAVAPASAVVKMLEAITYSIRKMGGTMSINGREVDYFIKFHFQTENGIIVTTDACCQGIARVIPKEDAEEYLHKQVICTSTKGKTFYGTVEGISQAAKR